MVDGASGPHGFASDRHRLVIGMLGHNRRPGRSAPCGPPRCRPVHVAAGADLRRCVLLLLALSCTAITLSGLLVSGAVLSCTGGSGVPCRYRKDPHPTGEVEDPYVVHRGEDLDVRRLHDGNEYQVVEIFDEPMELQSLLGRTGLDCKARFNAAGSSSEKRA